MAVSESDAGADMLRQREEGGKERGGGERKAKGNTERARLVLSLLLVAGFTLAALSARQHLSSGSVAWEAVASDGDAEAQEAYPHPRGGVTVVVDAASTPVQARGGTGALLALLCAVAAALRAYNRSGAEAPSSGESDAGDEAAAGKYKAFRRLYLVVYVLAMAADWMQGPYVYALYTHYGFSEEEIAQLFVAGFGASLVFGMVAGPLADRFGRRLSCVAYGIVYAVGCVLKHSGSFRVLMVGRLLAGAATSILFSSFEAWMVAEHNASGFSAAQLSATFSASTTANGLVAIASGVVSSAVREEYGPVGPFDVALALLVAVAAVTSTTWGENYGNESAPARETLAAAWRAVLADRSVLLTGLAQSLFEGAMYIFVFMWTPALESADGGLAVEHGWVFACFMVCVLVGSELFSAAAAAGVPVERALSVAMAAAACALAAPAFTTVYAPRMLAFCVYEACVGVFWPCIGCLRGTNVPENVRATVSNIFRVPLNMIVIVVLLRIGDFKEANVFLAAAACVAPALWAVSSMTPPAAVCEVAVAAPAAGNDGDNGEKQ